MFTYFCCGWEPIISPNCLPVDWKTLSGKRLKLEDIQRIHSDPTRLIGLRHDCKTTSYILLDIDHSSYCRKIDSIREICGLMCHIGLRFPIFIQSSNKGNIYKGIHIYWFLDKSYNTSLLAELVRTLLESYNFISSPGNLEIFPNESNGTRYKCKPVRLPLQPDSGSYILDENLQPYSDSIDELNRLILASSNSPNFSILELDRKSHEIVPSEKAKQWLKRVDALLRRGFTTTAQTQELIRAAIDKVIVFSKITDLDIVCDKVKAIIISLNGYTQYCGHQGNIDKVIRTWVTQTLNKEIRAPYYKKMNEIVSGKELINDGVIQHKAININKAKTKDTLTRLVGCIDWLVKNDEINFNSLRAFRSRVKEISRQLYGIGIDEKTVQAQKPMWEGRIHVGKQQAN